MFNKENFAAIRLRTCSIGVLKVPISEVENNPSTPFFKILGTGFLIGSLTVLTNRHVVSNVTQYIEKESLPKDRRHVVFLRSDSSGLSQTFHEIEKMGMATQPTNLDLGLISFKATPNDPIRSLTPVEVPENFTSEVGDSIAVYGFAFGENLLKREVDNRELIYRFEPILQQGYISALSPFEHAPIIDRFLLDVRTAKGMSGSPVFDPKTGLVLAIHNSGIEDTVAFAIPISRHMVAEFLNAHDSSSLGNPTTIITSFPTRSSNNQ
jgi:S1-C subfamily serine protease